ncbi:phosphopentomutase [Persicobacter psychrovividus]|uniref:Phosphopentomutase n=1 Tax=Persicobacter psychrovividus TaxID=387638 RepID=A0ABM7VF85_9BACT|nr:phosphopentomutase [Persicobacter psychrovividus]
MKEVNRVILIILDSVGVGFAADAHEYGDLGANTLGHIADAVGLNVPNMQRMGLGNIGDFKGIAPIANAEGAFGKAKEVSKGKDTTTGHWEIAGELITTALPTYPDGFPEEIISEFEQKTGKKTFGNKVASGTAIINELGDQHVATGDLIVYTSADSVFQIAAHEEVVPLEDLYRYCEIAREMLSVGRVIARPFVGTSGQYTRTSGRHDYALEPGENMLSRIQAAGLDVRGVGKISDIFAGKGITHSVSTKNNMEGVDRTIEWIKEENKGLIFTNLVDFDMHFGHRRDVYGYQNALQEWDARIPEILAAMKEDDVLIISADHGNDPIFKGTDHTREHIPLLVAGQKVKAVNLGLRPSFKDIGETIEHILLQEPKEGSFANEILSF